MNTRFKAIWNTHFSIIRRIYSSHAIPYKLLSSTDGWSADGIFEYWGTGVWKLKASFSLLFFIFWWCWQFSRFTDYSDKSNWKNSIARFRLFCRPFHRIVGLVMMKKMFIYFFHSSTSLVSIKDMENLVHQKFHSLSFFEWNLKFVCEMFTAKQRVNTVKI
jgi:hypothetical protein